MIINNIHINYTYYVRTMYIHVSRMIVLEQRFSDYTFYSYLCTLMQIDHW